MSISAKGIGEFKNSYINPFDAGFVRRLSFGLFLNDIHESIPLEPISILES